MAWPLRVPTRTGFSLIELLVAIAIIAVLMGMLFPAIGAVRSSALAAKCKSNLRQIAMAHIAYATDSNGALPPSTFVPTGVGTTQRPWYVSIGSYLDRNDAPNNNYQANNARVVNLQVMCPVFIKEYPFLMSGQNNCKGYVRNAFLLSSASNAGASDYRNNASPTPFKLIQITYASARVLAGDGFSMGTGSSEAVFTRGAPAVATAGYQYDSLAQTYLYNQFTPARTPPYGARDPGMVTQDLHKGKRSYVMCDGSIRKLTDDYTNPTNQLYLSQRSPELMP